jgi:hypothetical protein
MRRFELHRDEDLTGISGTGVVAEGIEFQDLTCALRWLTEHRSTAIYASAEDIQAIHGHQGRTRLTWVDPPDVDQDVLPPSARARLGARRQEMIDRLAAFQ